MTHKFLNFLGGISLLLILLPLSSCSPSSYTSAEGLTGTLIGTGIGSGIGWFLGEELGKKKENIAVNAAIGGGAGLLGGALLHEKKISLAKEREVVIREALLIDENQKELDNLRNDLDESTNWGRGEVKPWDQRYLDYEDDRPHHGSRYNSPR